MEKPILLGEDKKALLFLARETIGYYLEKRREPEADDLSIKLTKNMKQVMGAFVTLHENKKLRGCIGEIVPRRPLYKAVIAHAVNASVNDPRFYPVRKEDVRGLEIEISALTPPREVPTYKDIITGQHGVVLKKDYNQAVFLPQVAGEQGWGVEETLTHLAMKAGLPADGWRQGCSFMVFEAIVFSEDEFNG